MLIPYIAVMAGIELVIIMLLSVTDLLNCESVFGTEVNVKTIHDTVKDECVLKMEIIEEKLEKVDHLERIIMDQNTLLNEQGALINSLKMQINKQDVRLNAQAKETEITQKKLKYVMDSQDDFFENVEKGNQLFDDKTKDETERIEKRTVTAQSYKTPTMGAGDRSRAIEGPGIAFSTYLAHSLTDLQDNMPVRFDGIFLYEGNAYNTFTWIFTVPVDGVYIFSFFIEDHYADEVHIKLVDGAYIADTVVEPRENGHDVMRGNLIIKRLQQGQSV